MSDKFGIWCVVDKVGDLFTFPDRAQAKDAADRYDKLSPEEAPHRMIYMQETDPPKEEVPCPVMTLGDVVLLKSGQWGLIREWGVMLLKDGIDHSLLPIVPFERNNVTELIRNGTLLWWKGKLKD